MAEIAAIGYQTWLSVEPLLGPVDVRPALESGIRWVVAGGESGPGARPCELDWLRDIRDACREVGVPFFLKQLGGRSATKRGKRGGDHALLDGERHVEWPSEPWMETLAGGRQIVQRRPSLSQREVRG